MAPLTSYQRRLFVFLTVATFFEGYDFMALAQILPNLREDLGLSRAEGGWLVAVVNVGTVVAYLLVRQADFWGRRRLLLVTIVGYTLCTFLTGFSPNAWVFAGLQLVARVFLIAEWAISMVIAAEEYPAERRGMVLGVIGGAGSLGNVVCAGVVPLLLNTEYGWRSVYFVGIVPLVLIAIARRSLRETERYERVRATSGHVRRPLMAILRTPYRRRILQLAAIWALTYMCTTNGVTFWKEFATSERGLTDGQVGLAITIAALVSMPLVFMSGKLLDIVGRRRGAAIIYTVGVAGVLASYVLHGQWPLTVGLVFGIFGAAAVIPVLNAYTTELFPTELRSDAFAWANNLLGRIGYIGSPIVIGLVADDIGWGWAIRATLPFPLIALVLILVLLPETVGKELEETAALPARR